MMHFLQEYLKDFSRELFSQKSSILDVCLGSKYNSNSIHTNLPILLNTRIIRHPGRSWKIKSTYSYHFQ